MTWKAFRYFFFHMWRAVPPAAYSVHFPRLFNSTMNCVANHCNNCLFSFFFFGPCGPQENVILAHGDVNRKKKMCVLCLGEIQVMGLMYTCQREQISGGSAADCCCLARSSTMDSERAFQRELSRCPWCWNSAASLHNRRISQESVKRIIMTAIDIHPFSVPM